MNSIYLYFSAFSPVSSSPPFTAVENNQKKRGQKSRHYWEGWRGKGRRNQVASLYVHISHVTKRRWEKNLLPVKNPLFDWRVLDRLHALHFRVGFCRSKSGFYWQRIFFSLWVVWCHKLTYIYVNRCMYSMNKPS